MTTGPININLVERFTNSKISIRRNGTQTVQTYPNAVSRYLYKTRPVSSKGAFIRGGTFRLPTGYYHRGAYGVAPRDTVTRYHLNANPAPTTVIEERWIDGSFWGLGQDNSPPELPGWVRSVAELKALENLKAQQVNYSVALAEGRKTIRMVGDRLMQIADGVRKWRKSNPASLWRKVKRGGRNVPRSWLELQYGWNPLMSDVLGSCAALRDPWNRGLIVEAKGYGVHEGLAEWPVGSAHVSGAYYTMQSKYRLQCWVKLWYALDTAELAAVSSLGLTNPATLVWELVPYSFVLDWFIPIGRWLDVLDADLGFGFIAGRRAVVREEDRRAAGVTFPNDPRYSYQGSATAEYKLKWFDRFPITSTPSPRLYFKSPLSLAHVANGLSLLASALDRR
jgi:hypothetical protein